MGVELVDSENGRTIKRFDHDETARIYREAWEPRGRNWHVVSIPPVLPGQPMTPTEIRHRIPDTPTIEAPAYVETMTEAQFQALTVDTARTHGWLVEHIRNMLGNRSGLPDLMLWRADQYLLIELKAKRGELSPRQVEWHFNAAEHGVRVHTFWPHQWPELEALLRKGNRYE